ncbi:MAG: ABC transporter permease [Steroidobacteraceae bacterium]
MTLALSTLLYEWRRYLAAVIALAVAGLLVLAMTGMFMGLTKTFSATVDHTPAQILIAPPDATDLFDSRSGLPRRVIPQIYSNPNIVEVQPLNIGGAPWSNFPKPGQPAKDTFVMLVIVNPVKGDITLPIDFSDELIQALREPYAIIVDKSTLGKLGVQVGDKAKVANQTVWVRGVTSGYPSMFQSMTFVSVQTAKLLRQYNDGDRVGVILAKINDPTQERQVVDQLNAASKGRYKAWTREDLSHSSQMSMLSDGPIAVMIGFAVVVSAFIGIVITWQTLQGAILANIKEFASLRALGVSMRRLRLVVMELSMWVGIAGLLLTVALTAFVWFIAITSGVPLDFPLFVDIPVGLALLGIAIFSGAMSLGVLKKSQPADLLR